MNSERDGRERDRIRRLRPAGYAPASTRQRDGHCLVVCGVCEHESIGDFFGAVWSLNPKDAWYRHRLHVDEMHPAPDQREAEARLLLNEAWEAITFTRQADDKKAVTENHLLERIEGWLRGE